MAYTPPGAMHRITVPGRRHTVLTAVPGQRTSTQAEQRADELNDVIDYEQGERQRE